MPQTFLSWNILKFWGLETKVATTLNSTERVVGCNLREFIGNFSSQLTAGVITSEKERKTGQREADRRHKTDDRNNHYSIGRLADSLSSVEIVQRHLERQKQSRREYKARQLMHRDRRYEQIDRNRKKKTTYSNAETETIQTVYVTQYTVHNTHATHKLKWLYICICWFPPLQERELSHCWVLLKAATPILYICKFV